MQLLYLKKLWCSIPIYSARNGQIKSTNIIFAEYVQYLLLPFSLCCRFIKDSPIKAFIRWWIIKNFMIQ